MKLFWNIVLALVFMNLAMFLGCGLAGADFEPNLIINGVVPVICGYISWEGQKRKAARRASITGRD